MTSPRRQAMAQQGADSAERQVSVGPPAELLDPGHKVWRTRKQYEAFMQKHFQSQGSWFVNRRLRPDAEQHRAPRMKLRNDAALTWAVRNGITVRRFGDANLESDLGRLRRMGVYGS